MGRKFSGKTADQMPSFEEQIRQIVREEIAAHEERRHQEVIDFLAATEELVRGTSGSQE